MDNEENGWKMFSYAMFVFFAIAIVGFGYYSVAAPAYERVHRQVFVSTPSYVQGTIDRIRKDQIDYLKETDPAVKSALKSMIIHDADSIEEKYLPYDLSQFVRQLRAN